MNVKGYLLDVENRLAEERARCALRLKSLGVGEDEARQVLRFAEEMHASQQALLERDLLVRFTQLEVH